MILAVILCGKIPFEDEIRYNVTYFGRATVFLDSNLKRVPIRESDFLKIILEYRHILCACSGPLKRVSPKIPKKSLFPMYTFDSILREIDDATHTFDVR